MIKIDSDDLNNYFDKLNTTKTNLNNLNDIKPFLQEKLDSKYPKVLLNISNDELLQNNFKVTNKQVSKLQSVNYLTKPRLPFTRSPNQIKLKNNEEKKRRSPINFIAQEIAEQTVLFLLKGGAH